MRGFLVIAGVGLAVRLFAAFILGGYVPPGDPAVYMALAEHVLAGQGLFVDLPSYGDNLRAFMPPLYPLLLAGTGSLLGVNPLSITLLNSALDIGAAWFVYLLAGRKLFPAAFFLLWPTVILNAIVAQKESLCMVLVAALAYLFVYWRPKRSIAFGICAGLLALTQPGLVFFPAFLCLLLPVREWRQGAFAGAVGLLTISPWIIRNAIVLHAFVPFTTAAGFSLARALNGQHIPPPASVLAMPEAMRSAAVGSATWHVIVAEPLRYLSAVARDVFKAVGKDSFAFYRAFPFGNTGALVLIQTLYVSLIGFAGAGLLKAIPPVKRLALASLLTTLTMIWFEFGQRHRYFLYPLLAVVAADAIMRLFVARQASFRISKKVSV